ncbi:MAG: deoxyhypusine synthase [Thermoplasmata archaeon]|nr:MAG: deoxyhypusine synthase [Thermoplasmata archaeon]
MKKEDFLKEEIEHINIENFDSTQIIETFRKMSFQARNLANAASIYDTMLVDNDCSIILCLAGSLFSAGLKVVVRDLVRHNMVDAIVSTGAIMVDQDFFEALGYKHYKGSPYIDDEMLRRMMIDRIYDTYIDEEQLRICDMTVAEIADSLLPKPYSSQEFLWEMGRYLHENKKDNDSVVLECFKRDVPIFVPAFSDCSAGFGLLLHQRKRGNKPKVTIDSVKDFFDLTRIKTLSKETGLVMIGGGVPKNFAQDIIVAADILGANVSMHKYAIQITVADERDGGLSGSTLKEAHSWGKVNNVNEQMVFSEATIAFPLIASYVFHKGNWNKRKPKAFIKKLWEIKK